MNFFHEQDRARSLSKKLIKLYLLSVFFTSLLVSLGLTIAVCFFLASGRGGINYDKAFFILKNNFLNYFLKNFLGTSIFIFLVSYYKIVKLNNPGPYVAKLVGAKPVDLDTKNIYLRRYINVVQEMALASGTPCPQIYVVESEMEINAFAAGHDINDSIISITKGCLIKLNRDELQGVVAHEFSHIINGDMKLNVRMIGVLYGLVIISMIGSFLMRMGWGSTSYRRRHRTYINRGRSRGQAALFIVGGIIFIGGWIGHFLARWIKSSILQQREYLADASAVQFTRNPAGIESALKKIYVSEGLETSFLNCKNVDEVSHMFFENIMELEDDTYSSHPPLFKRIKTINKYFSRKLFVREEKEKLLSSMEEKVKTYEQNDNQIPYDSDELTRVPHLPGMGVPLMQMKGTDGKSQKVTEHLENKLDHIEDIEESQYDYARNFIQNLTGFLEKATKRSKEAKALCYCYLMDMDNVNFKKQIYYLDSLEKGVTFQEMMFYFKEVKNFGLEHRFSMLSLAISVLKNLSKEEIEVFLRACLKLMKWDVKISYEEFIIFYYLKIQLYTRQKFYDKSFNLKQLKVDIVNLLSLMCHIGSIPFENTKPYFDDAVKYMGFQTEFSIMRTIEYKSLTKTLDRVAQAKPEIKKKIISALVRIAEADNKMSLKEYETIRLISECLLVPMPPIVPESNSGL